MYGPRHVCKKTFLAFMGADEETDDDDEELTTEVHDSEVITEDISHLYALEDGKRIDAIELLGTIGTTSVRILVDTGATHDFLHPDVAQKLALPLKRVKPFRVCVGNDSSLVCSYASIQTRVVIQKHVFLLDLHILPVHDMDMVLGMKWLRSLRHVTSDYDEGTIEFVRQGKPVCLCLVSPVLCQVALRTFARLMSIQGEATVFELVQVHPQLSSSDADAARFSRRTYRRR